MKNTLKITTLFLLSVTFSQGVFSTPEFVGLENKQTSISPFEYWTPERMNNAKEMPLPKPIAPKEIQENVYLESETEFHDGAPPEDAIEPDMRLLYVPKNENFHPMTKAFDFFNRGTSGYNFSSSRLIPLSADLEYPYRAIGKLFVTIPGEGDFVCSGVVLHKRIVATAGHCVHRGSGGSAGYYTNFLFVPAFRDGAAPFKAWGWTHVMTTSAWSTSGGSVPNAADYALIEIADQPVNGEMKSIGSVTGYLGYQTQSLIPNHAHLLGYPCNFDYCEKMHQVTAQSQRQVAPNNVEYGSDMMGGSSGGPWVQNFGLPAVGQTGGKNPGLNRIIGITSYGYVTNDFKAQGSSILDSRFTTLYNNMCARNASNCA